MRIALHKGTGFISRLICWQTRSCYSHVSVVLTGGIVIESREFKGVRMLAQLDPKENVDLFEVQLSQLQETQITHFLFAQLDKPYDYGMVARFISRRQASRQESGRWFCSEIVFAAFQKAGINLLDRIEPWAVSPSLISISPLLKKVE